MDLAPRVLLASLLLILGLSLSVTAREDGDEEVAPDQPVRIETGLFHAPVRLCAEDGIMDSGPSWGHSSPWVVDVDGDGVKDLVVGDFSGLFHFYRNVGSNRK